MKKRIIIYTLVCFAVLGTSLSAQTDISMATHWYNRANYNPASIARTDYIYLFSNIRNQWVGVEGAPKVVNVQASGYVNSLNSAFGLSAVNDRIGITNAFNPMFSYAYRIADDPNWALSAGLSLGAFIRSIDVGKYSSVDPNDPVLYNDNQSMTRPDANVGIEFQNRHFIAGLSSTHLFSIGKTDSIYLNANHRYLYGIYKNTNSDVFNYYLGFQLVNRYNIFVLEGNGFIRFKRPTGWRSGSIELFDLGLTYRSSKQLTALFGIYLSDNFRLGYAFDQSFITGYNQNGSHEIMLEYRIPSKTAECIPCRDQELWYR